MNKKGFTLIEMLAVIAIIAVLVAIVIPTVSSATEKAKEAADVANIRSAVAEVTTKALSGAELSELSKPVPMTQGTDGFVVEVDTIGGISSAQLALIENVTADDTANSVTVISNRDGGIFIQIGETVYGADGKATANPNVSVEG